MKTWFITGTSSGIGRLLTEELLLRGDRVAATLRTPEALDDLKEQFSDHLWVSALDVRIADDVRRVVDRAAEELGRIDVVVNNAGYGLFGAAEELADEQIDRLVETNLIGSMNVVRAILPHMRIQGKGRIVQISSEGGQTTYPGFAAYHATKWGIEGFIEAVASEGAPFGIDCNIVEFGPTATNFGASLVQADPMAAYTKTPVGESRRNFAAGTAFRVLDDPRDVVRQAITRVGVEPGLRLIIGEYARKRVRDSLDRRLAETENQLKASSPLNSAGKSGLSKRRL